MDRVTGIHFHRQDKAAIIEAVAEFERHPDLFERETIRKHALKFSAERFKTEVRDFVRDRWREHLASL